MNITKREVYESTGVCGRSIHHHREISKPNAVAILDELCGTGLHLHIIMRGTGVEPIVRLNAQDMPHVLPRFRERLRTFVGTDRALFDSMSVVEMFRGGTKLTTNVFLYDPTPFFQKYN